jgi:hypothetical protein
MLFSRLLHLLNFFLYLAIIIYTVMHIIKY